MQDIFKNYVHVCSHRVVIQHVGLHMICWIRGPRDAPNHHSKNNNRTRPTKTKRMPIMFPFKIKLKAYKSITSRSLMIFVEKTPLEQGESPFPLCKLTVSLKPWSLRWVWPEDFGKCGDVLAVLTLGRVTWEYENSVAGEFTLSPTWFNGNDEVAVFFKVTNVGGTHVFTELWLWEEDY